MIIKDEYDTFDGYVDALEDRVAELEAENARLRDTIIYTKGRMKAYGIVDARIDLPGGWNEK